MNERLDMLERTLATLRERVRAWKHGGAPALPPVWWVLAYGDSFEGLSFEERDEARARLREAVSASGILVPEHVWVWDETNRAQLVLATLHSREMAARLAARMGNKGLAVRIKRADP
ncbi:hypothetical protein M7784_16435 [Desulfovibrio aminophilus]|nr:hypothetical protein [Desulfovibrio aminophilus]MCM0756823.1 hypothetical protein [Desulfovibrio aminophilus]